MDDKQCTFPKQQRLSHKSEFDLIYKQGKRVSVGPLLIYSLKNELGESRLGLSISKRVGNAVKRNAIKRRCREAFRLNSNLSIAGLDIIINVRPHELLSCEEYASHISDGTQ